MPRKTKAKPTPVDPDLDVWVRLGGAEPESALEGMSETEKQIAHGNAWIRSQLQPIGWRTAPRANPFGRD